MSPEEAYPIRQDGNAPEHRPRTLRAKIAATPSNVLMSQALIMANEPDVDHADDLRWRLTIAELIRRHQAERSTAA